MKLIPLELIDPNPYQPRQSHDNDALMRLARGIRLKRELLPDTCGLMQVPIARQLPAEGEEGGRYQLAFGHRRLEAFKYNNSREAGGETLDDGEIVFPSKHDWSKMPLEIVDLSDEEMYDFAARENGDREDLNPIEKARSILEAQNTFGWNLARAASAHGLTKSAGSNLTRLLQLPDAVQQMLVEDAISQRHARELVRLVQAEIGSLEVVNLGQQVIDSDLSVNYLKTEVDTLLRIHTNRRLVAERIAGQTCPRCDAPVTLHPYPKMSFGCGMHAYGGVIEFEMDWRMRHIREDEERKMEQRRQETHTRYCPRCNHPQDFTGEEVYGYHEGDWKRCLNCHEQSIMLHWLKEARVIKYRLLRLDGGGEEPEPEPDQEPEKTKPACPWWLLIPDTAETCYICGEPAIWHNNADLTWPGADFHLCNQHYWDAGSGNINGHTTEAQLSAILDRLKAREQEREKEQDEPEPDQCADCGKPGHFDSYHELSDNKRICFDCYKKRSSAIAAMTDEEYHDHLEQKYLEPANEKPADGQARLSEILGWIEGLSNTMSDRGQMETVILELEALSRTHPDLYEQAELIRITVRAILQAMETGEINLKHVPWLVTVPSGDINFKSHLQEADLATIRYALALLPAAGNKIKIQRLTSRLNTLEKIDGQRRQLHTTINNQFMELTRRATLDQLQKTGRWLTDLRQTVFPENTPEELPA